MRPPGLYTTVVVFTLMITTFIFLELILQQPITITKGAEDLFSERTIIHPSISESENAVKTASIKPSKEDKIDFEISQLNSTLPRLKQLYPGGFNSPKVLPCSKYYGVQLLVVVHSAPSHVDRRRAIRNSWAAPDQLPSTVRVVFLIGEGGNRDPKIEPSDDVIIANFVDTYRNLTLKSVAMLDWAVHNCPDAEYLLKCDDDVYVNIDKLIVELEMDFNRKNTIIGRIAYAWKPIRNAKSKYYISYEEFSPPVLPNFTTGPAYLVEGGSMQSLLEAALDEPWLSLEDVFLTGLVGGARIGATLVHWPAFLNNRATLTVCNAQRLIAIHNVKPKEQLKLVKLSKFSGRSCAMRDARTKNSKVH